MTHSPIRHLASRALDPFGFHDAFSGLTLATDELPSLTRDRRLAGLGT